MGENISTYQAVRIGDVSDWRLIALISATGMSAYLKNTENPAEEVVTLFDEKWEGDSSTWLNSVENAVYAHPQVLDDFSSDIAIVAPEAVWVPSEYGDDDDRCAELYSAIYPTSPEDIMQEEAAGALCLYSLVPGLHSFLQRTFPGARCHSHLAVLARRFGERGADMPVLYADVRENEVDILLFDNRRLLLGVTHRWRSPEDIDYHIYNIINVYGLDPKQMQVSLSGLRDVRSGLMKRLRGNIAFVMLTMLPGLGVKAGMPLPAVLLLRDSRK